MILQERGKQFTLTVPKRVVEGLGWKKGDRIVIKIGGKDKLELVRS